MRHYVTVDEKAPKKSKSCSDSRTVRPISFTISKGRIGQKILQVNFRYTIRTSTPYLFQNPCYP